MVIDIPPPPPRSGDGFLRRGSQEDSEGFLHLRGVQGELVRPRRPPAFLLATRKTSCLTFCSRPGEAEAEDPRGALRRRRPSAGRLRQAGEQRETAEGAFVCLSCMFVTVDRLRPLAL